MPAAGTVHPTGNYTAALARPARLRAKLILDMSDQPTPAPEELADPGELAPEDFYFDGEYMVFTAAYHSKRGYCCNSECRHCPYR